MVLENAFVSLIFNDEYASAAEVMFYSLKKTNTSASFVGLLTGQLKKERIRNLESLGVHLVSIEDITNGISVNGLSQPHFTYTTMNKIHYWNQTKYQKVIALDTDMVILKNIDSLFSKIQKGKMLGAPACLCNPTENKEYPLEWTPLYCKKNAKSKNCYINTGLIGLVPDDKEFTILKNTFQNNIDVKLKFTDQEFLNNFFDGSIIQVDRSFNYLRTSHRLHPLGSNKSPYVYHLILEKPWNKKQSSWDIQDATWDSFKDEKNKFLRNKL